VPSLLRQLAVAARQVFRYRAVLFLPPMASELGGADACMPSVYPSSSCEERSGPRRNASARVRPSPGYVDEPVVDSSGWWPRHSCPEIGNHRQPFWGQVDSPSSSLSSGTVSAARASSTIGAMSLRILNSNL
jgi:hypothetical protein